MCEGGSEDTADLCGRFWGCGFSEFDQSAMFHQRCVYGTAHSVKVREGDGGKGAMKMEGVRRSFRLG